MKKYTVKDILEQRISFKNLSKFDIEKLRIEFYNYTGNKRYISTHLSSYSTEVRFYPNTVTRDHVLGSISVGSYFNLHNAVKCSKVISIDEFDFTKIDCPIYEIY